jgi:hypothetical protein
VSSYAPLTIDGLEVASFRNGVDLSVALLFGPNEFVSRPAVGDEVERWEYTTEDEDVTIYELVSTSSSVRDRLDVLGIGMTVVRNTFDELIKDKSDRSEQLPLPTGADPRISEDIEEESKLVSEMTLERWIELVKQRHQTRQLDGPTRRSDSLSWLIGLWDESDHRVLIRALLAALPRTSEIRIDVTDIVDGGYMSLDVNPHEEALKWMADETSKGSPVIVLTEGRSDARILQSAVEVLKPHLKDFLRFPDFSLSPESSASALVKTVKTFASAGIRNRVVAIFDNDTAADDALRALVEDRLPRNISFFRLPYLLLASAYPTIGPSGTVVMDVNGLAGSIELYVGEDVLRDHNGELRPVQWRGFNDRLNRYQGEVTHKRAVQEAFDAKVNAALAEKVRGIGADWTGLDLILNTMVRLLSD